MPCLFVYGTLKSGLCRHAAIKDQQYIGQAKTVAHYRLFDLGSFPGMIESADGRCIPGELYDVDGNCLEMLDRIEGVDEGLYRRSNVSLVPPEDRLQAITYLYLLPTTGCPEVSCWPPQSDNHILNRD